MSRLETAKNNFTQNWGEGYRVLRDIVRNEIPSGQIDSGTRYWYEKAGEVNRNEAGSQANIYIRTAAALGLGLTANDLGHPLVQLMSDEIAKSVFGDINRLGAIPKSNEFFIRDISNSIAGNATLGLPGIPVSGWGGTFYYWNLQFAPPGKPDPVTVGSPLFRVGGNEAMRGA